LEEVNTAAFLLTLTLNLYSLTLAYTTLV